MKVMKVTPPANPLAGAARGGDRVLQNKDLKLGAVAQPLRAALTGRAVSPPIFTAAALLGRDEVLARLELACRSEGAS